MAPVVTQTVGVLERVGGERQVSLRVDYSRGSPLLLSVHPVEGPEAGTAAEALPVEAAICRLRGRPAWPRSPGTLAADARYVLRSHAERGLLPTLELLSGGRWALVPAPNGVAGVISALFTARATQSPAMFRGVLPVGISAGFSVRALTVSQRGGALEGEGGRLVARRLGERRLELGVEVVRTTHRSTAAGLGVPESELALLDPLELPEGMAFVLAAPSPFSESDSWGFGVVLLVPPLPPAGTPADDAHQAAFEACVAALDSAQPLAPLPPPALRPLEVPPAISATLGRRGSRRAALAALAAVTSAALTADLARSAPEALLEEVATRLLARGSALEPSPALGLDLERATIGALQALEPVGDAERAVVRRYAGAAAPPLDWLDHIAGEVSSLEALVAELTARNQGLLRDASPALRTAAHAWLCARGSAVPDYDPLAPRAERSRALRADQGEESR